MPGPELLAGYDAWLVTVSIVVAVLASYAALDLSARISAAPRGWGRASWIVGGAIAMGCGIWSMHFIAMLVYGIVKQSGGTVTCDSVPGRGTTFRVFLPAVESSSVYKVANA